MTRWHLFVIVLAAAGLQIAGCSEPARDHGHVDLAILDGLIVDGTGAPPRAGDVLVRGDEIIFVGDANEKGLDAKRVIRATDRLVTPGFIDLHSHGNPLTDRSFANFLLQGVTTIVLGQDGRSPQAPDPGDARAPGAAASLADWLDAIGRTPLEVNVAALSGFGTIREAAGVGASPVPTAAQLAAERELLSTDLAAGAFGMSSGLEYPPDRYSRTAELVALAEVVGEHGGVVMSHMRTEDDNAIAGAIGEMAAQGRHARVNISHLKIVFGQSREQAEAVLAQIRNARASGIEMSADVYPYLAGFADLSLVYPPWAMRKEQWDVAVRDRRSELEAWLHARVTKRNGPGAILIASGPDAGLTLEQVAKREKMSFVDVIIGYGFGGPDAAHRVMSAEVQEVFIAAPDIAISTDGGPEIRHPRSWGSYPKVLRDYVVDSDRLLIEIAIYKMTGLPARTMRLFDRGRIMAGAKADLLVIDLDAVESTATWEKFDQVPGGFDAVIVAGKVAAERGRQTSGRFGRVLRRQPSKPQ